MTTQSEPARSTRQTPQSLFDPMILWAAVGPSFAKLGPRVQIRTTR